MVSSLKRARCLARYEELRGGTLHAAFVREYAIAPERCFAEDAELAGGGRPMPAGPPSAVTVVDATEDTLILDERFGGEGLVSYNELRGGRIAWRAVCESEAEARSWARRRASQRVSRHAIPNVSNSHHAFMHWAIRSAAVAWQ